MKTIKHIYTTAIAALAMAGMLPLNTACSDLLDKQPTASISDASFWKSQSDAELALTGCYRFQTGWSHDDFATPQGLLYLDFAGGNGTEKENFTTLMASTNTQATNSNLYWYWANAYTQIANYNTFLDNIDNCPMDETLKTQMKSEVKSLRAYFFFNLAFYFKDVPMPLTTLTREEANTISQTPQADVYTQVENDLKEAVNVLPEKYSNDEYGRFTKGAALTLLSRLYLAQERWSDVVDVLGQVINSGNYDIDTSNGEDSYEKLFQIGGEYSPETIFCIMGIKDKFTNSRYQYLYPECAYGGWHQFAPYNELVKEYFCSDGKSIEESSLYNDDDPYVNREPRLYASIFLPPLGSYPGTKYNDLTYDCFQGPNTADAYNKYTLFDGYCPKKGCDPSITSNLSSTYTYTPIMRYAEVLLSYVEALNESQPGSVTQQVLDQTINKIRARVSLPGLQKSELNQEQLRQAIRKERRVELAFEGLRYFDVLRWGIASQVLNHYFTGVKLSDDPSARNYRGSGSSASPVDEDGYYQFEQRAWDSHNRYFPIPQNEMNVNKNLKQNDGYN